MSKVLARAVQDLGDPLPFRFTNVDVYPGYLVILLAAPGVGKSFLGLNWAIDLVSNGTPVLYHSTDTDLRTQALRLTAILKEQPIKEVNVETAADWLSRMVLPLRWSQAPVDSSNVEALVQAEVEYLGQAPALVIVDVANDLRKGEENAGNVRDVFQALHRISRKYETTVLAMHHIKRGFASGGKHMPSMDDGLYGGEHVAELVLGMCAPTPGELRIGVLKNRTGESGFEVSHRFAPQRGLIGG